ncbi:MAG: hypothetical protein ABH856_02080 [Patescibacteria group bacterium]|nr:hypothetical protein [Patescibacteria group bacterium]
MADDQTQTGQTKTDDDKFAIPKVVKEKYPDLIELIKGTESMNDDEREYWFQILPIMTDEQVEKFRGILDNEKKQLQKLDKEYEDELQKLNDKHLVEWQQFETEEKRKKLKVAEKKHEEEEQANEEALLDQLNNF